MAVKIPNLYTNKVKGKTYYRYRHPKNGTWHGMGSDRRKAVQAARELNSQLMGDNPLIARVLNNTVSVSDHIDWFMRNHIPKITKSPSTIGMYQTHFNKLNRLCGEKPINAVTVKELSDYMESECTPDIARQFRQCGTKLWSTAIAKGLAEDNPAEKTMVVKVQRRRARLRIEVFNWMKQHSEPWFHNTLNIALVTLQRRGDLSNMKRADIWDGHLHVIQQKTEKYDSSRLSIELTPQLQALIDKSYEIVPASPYLVCRVPVRKNSKKDHWSKVEPDMLSREFRKLVLKCPLLTQEERENPPTIHEVRALGIKLYRDQGKDPQGLAGHSNESMTDAYDSGHTNSRWNNVKADLDL